MPTRWCHRPVGNENAFGHCLSRALPAQAAGCTLPMVGDARRTEDWLGRSSARMGGAGDDRRPIISAVVAAAGGDMARASGAAARRA